MGPSRGRRTTAPSPAVAAALSQLRTDPDLRARRSWRDSLRLGLGVGLPVGFVPAALLFELAPQAGILVPGAWSFAGSAALFIVLARARHRALVWVVAAAVSLLLLVGALAATAWTLTTSVADALA